MLEFAKVCIVVALASVAIACGDPGATHKSNGVSSNAPGGSALVVDCGSPLYVTVEPTPILLAANSTHVFVASSGSVDAPEVVQVVELSEMPRVVSTISLDARVADLAYAGGTLYVLNEAKLSAYDVSDPAAPTSLGELSLERPATSFAVHGDVAMVNATSALSLVTIEDPSAMALREPIELGPLGFNGFVNDVAMFEGDWFLSGHDGSLLALDGETLERLSLYTPEPPLEDMFKATGLARLGAHVAYVAGNQLMVADAADASDLKGVARTVAGRRNWVSQLAQLDDRIMVDTDLFDLSDPGSPTYAGRFQTTGFTITAVGANDDHLFVAYVKNQGEVTGLLEVTDPDCATLSDGI